MCNELNPFLLKLTGTADSLRLTLSTPMTTSSKPWQSSRPFAMSPTRLSTTLTRCAEENSRRSSPTGDKRRESVPRARVSFGSRPSTGFRKSVAMEQTTLHVTIRVQDGLRTPGPTFQASSTMVEDLSSFHGIITTANSPMCSLQAATTARCTCLRTQSSSIKMATWPWQLESGST